MDANLIKELAKKSISITRPNKRFNKVFGIGYNKTGSTSLIAIFHALALNCAIQHEQELLIVKQLYEGNYQPFKEYIARYDVFQDQPFSQHDWYILADAFFPNSRFILTIRDAEEWFDSMCRFHAKAYGVESVKELTESFFREKVHYLYEGYAYETVKHTVEIVKNGKIECDWSLLYNKDHYIKFYMDRNERILKYFKNRPKDLLVLDITNEKDISQILEFLEFPKNLNFAMPHANKTTDFKKEKAFLNKP